MERMLRYFLKEGNDKCSFLQISKETQSEVQWTQEENYMFRLTKFLDKIDEWITNRGWYNYRVRQNFCNICKL